MERIDFDEVQRKLEELRRNIEEFQKLIEKIRHETEAKGKDKNLPPLAPSARQASESCTTPLVGGAKGRN